MGVASRKIDGDAIGLAPLLLVNLRRRASRKQGIDTRIAHPESDTTMPTCSGAFGTSFAETSGSCQAGGMRSVNSSITQGEITYESHSVEHGSNVGPVLGWLQLGAGRSRSGNQ
jgi:hypothetical protein